MIGYIISVIAVMQLYYYLNLFIVKRRSQDAFALMQGAEPFFYPRGKKVALLIHGYSSSPQEFRDLAAYLASEGISVHAPLLPGHGTAPEQLAFVKYEAWVRFVSEQLLFLEQEFDHIYLVGNSFGGNLAFLTAHHSSKVRGIIALGTPMSFPRERIFRYFLLPILKRIRLFQKKRTHKDPYIKRLIQRKSVTYPVIPINNLLEVAKVVDSSKQVLGSLHVPLLLMQTPTDTVICNSSADYIMAHAGSRTKKVVSVPDSYHVFIIDRHARIAFKEILSFIQEH